MEQLLRTCFDEEEIDKILDCLGLAADDYAGRMRVIHFAGAKSMGGIGDLTPKEEYILAKMHLVRINKQRADL